MTAENPNFNPDINAAGTPEAASEAVAGYEMAEEALQASPAVRASKFGDSMRLVGASAMSMLGGMGVMEAPGIAAKVTGGALAAYGMREQYKSVVEANGQEMSKESVMMRMRQRVFDFGRSLIDRNTGRADLASRFKRRAAEELMSFEDRQYRIRFQRMMGGMALMGLGVEIMNQPTGFAKALGIATAAVGMHEHLDNLQKGHDRADQLHTAV